MKIKVFVLIAVGIIMFGSLAYASAQVYVPYHHHEKCLEIEKIPKFDMFGKEGYMISCIDINPFGK